MALCGIQIKSRNFRISIRRIGLKFNPSWSIKNPFRFLVIDLTKVHITQTISESKLGKIPKAEKTPQIEKNPKVVDLDSTCGKNSAFERLAIDLPQWVYNLLLDRGWLNEIGIHVSQIYYTLNHLEQKEVFFIDYIKFENTCSLSSSKLSISASALDGYSRRSSSILNESESMRFHNLEIHAKSSITFDKKETSGFRMVVSDLELLLIFGNLHIPNVSTYFNTTKHSSDETDQPESPSSKEIANLPVKKILSVVDLLSSVQIKVEQSRVSYHDITISSSSYSFSIVKDNSYRQDTRLKFYSIVTGAEMHHLGLKCLEFPSFNHILDINLSDAYRASTSENPNKFFLDVSSSFNLNSPLFNIYFDQLNLLWDASNRSSAKRNSAPKKNKKFSLKSILSKYERYYEYLRAVSFKVAVVDLKGTLHTPGIHTEKFERQSINNIVANAELRGFTIKTSSKNLSNLIHQIQAKTRKQGFRTHIRLKNLLVEVEKNAFHLSGCSVMVFYCSRRDEISLHIRNKQLWLKSVNTMIFHVIRRIREARITHKNNACAKLDNVYFEEQSDPNFAKQTLKRELLDLFTLLPPFISNIRIRGSHLLAYIICNDMLPSYKIFDEDLGEEIDLGLIKRGISTSVDGLNLFYSRDEKKIEVCFKDIEASTLSDSLAEFKNKDIFIDKESDFDDLSSTDSDFSSLQSFNSEMEVNTVKQVLKIPDLSLSNVSGHNSRLMLQILEVDVKLDIFLIWCVFYAQTLVTMVAPKIKKTFTEKQEQALEGLSKYVLLDIHVLSMAVLARIPHDVDILFEMEHLELSNVVESPECQINHVRLYCINPSTKLWSRLVCISEFFVNLKTATNLSVSLNSRSVKFSIPFQFLVYTVIDNLIAMAKAAKQIKLNFKSLSQESHDFTSAPVKAMKALSLPHIQWKTKTFGLCVENDAFETELAFIFELGQFEQIERLRKLALFEVEAEKLREKAVDKLTNAEPGLRQFVGKTKKSCTTTQKFAEFLGFQNNACSSREHRNGTDQTTSYLETVNSEFSSNFNYSDSMGNSTEELIEDEIERARENLLKDFGSSWIHKYQLFKKVKVQLWKDRSEKTWGSDNVLESFTNKYPVQDYAPGPPQMYVVFKDFDFTVEDPMLPDIDEFLHKHGKGTPKFEYSILIPAAMKIQSSFVYAGAKDYLLPIISFPANSVFGVPVFDFNGTIVINEKLIAIPEELRHIYIPFTPAVSKIKLEHNFYGGDVLRTLTPIKSMFDFKINLTTDRACNISYNKSYEPTLLSAMLALDNFTKPEIDDSPLGWWDKLALNAHGKVSIDIENQLCLHTKSSLSPYALSGDNSGLVFCWKDNVKLRINGTGDPQEFVLIQSDDFILGVPNYSLPERGSWSLLYADVGDFTTNYDLESRKFQKQIMKLTSDEGVTWRLGALFERNENVHLSDLGGMMKRTDKFKNHWDVCVTGPMYDYHPDSFEGYRSEYVHLAISVTAKSGTGNSYNYAYISPMTIKYFFTWWDTLTESFSLPTREGPLFSREAKKSSSVKFGPHIFTFKYQLVLEPLVISYMILSSGGKEINHRVMGTGIKAKFASCIIDLHQRREVARYVNSKLGIDKKVRKLKMNAGEIDVTNADIRLIQATFNDISLSGKILSYFTGETKTLIDVDLFANERNSTWTTPLSMHFFKNGSNSDQDYSWIDLEDFIELEYGETLSPDPAVQIVPFIHCPKLNYYRDFTLEKTLNKYPFGNEASHKCLIGLNPPIQVQAELLLNKVEQIRSQVERNEIILETTLDQSEKDSKTIKQAISDGKSKMDKFIKLHASISEDLLTRKPNLEHQQGEEVSNTAKLAANIARENKQQPQATGQLRETTSLSSDYHNRFLIHNLRMIWNNHSSELITSFLSLFGDKQSMRLSMSTKAVKFVENILKSTSENSVDKYKPVVKQRVKCGEDVVQAFEEYLNQIYSSEQELEHEYLIKFISPQIQLQSEVDSSSCAILAANDIELRISALNIEGTRATIHEDATELSLIETRHGVLFKDAYVFAFQKKNCVERSSTSEPYFGSPCLWPPWIDVEDCEESSLKENLVVEKSTMALSMTKPNLLSMDVSDTKTRSSETIVHLDKIVVNATSSQYSAIYFILVDLLMGGKETKNFLRERIKQVTSVSEVSDFLDTSDKVKRLQENIQTCRRVLQRINEYSSFSNNFEQRERDYMRLEIEKMKIELIILIRGIEYIGNKNSSRAATKNLSLVAEQIIIHLLEDSRVPLVDFALASSRYTSVEAHDGSNWNTVEVLMMQGFNLQPNAPYAVLLSPLSSDFAPKATGNSSMIKMSWHMLIPVGGIRVMSNAELKIQPLHVQLDYSSAIKLFSYLFPKEQTKDSPVSNDSHTHAMDTVSDSDSMSLESASASSQRNKVRNVLRKRDEKSDISSDQSSKSSYKGSSFSYEMTDTLTGSPSRTGSSLQSRRDSKSDSNADSSIQRSDSKTASSGSRTLCKRKTKKKEDLDDFLEIMDRSLTYFVIGEFTIPKFNLRLSFKAPKHLNIIDVHNLNVSIPKIHYADRTWSSHDFAVQLQKDIIKIVLAHSGKIIGNKFLPRRRERVSTPLKQIADYSQYMTIDDLQKDGRERGDTLADVKDSKVDRVSKISRS